MMLAGRNSRISSKPGRSNSLQEEVHQNLLMNSNGHLWKPQIALMYGLLVQLVEENLEANPDESHYTASRYIYFVQVDADSLRSVVYDSPQPPYLDSDDEFDPGDGFLSFAYRWSLDTPDAGEEVEAENRSGGDEDCTLEDAGWMRVPAHMVGSQLYTVLTEDSWYDHYVLPP
ncbi:hypothetical protein LTS08_002261 [Lithohypha guttulata]|nr:hypothetical protein LTS08_002261 [Lithohypha guttulata]